MNTFSGAGFNTNYKQENIMYNPIRSTLIAIFLTVITAATVSAQADDIIVAWDPNDPAEQVTEYKLYYKTGNSGTPSGPPYNGTGLVEGNSPITIPVGQQIFNENNPEYTLTGLTAGVTYQFAVTACNDNTSPDPNESRYSNEVTYFSPEPVGPGLDYIEIEGNPTIQSNTAQYTLRAHFNNDTSRPVSTTSWEVDCADAEISRAGMLTVVDVNADTKCTISASYDSGVITRSDQMDIVIKSASGPELDRIAIEGSKSVAENSIGDYNCIAYYTDGTSAPVPAESWNEDCNGADISPDGMLRTDEVDQNIQCTVSVRYDSKYSEMGIYIRNNNNTIVTLDRIAIEGPDSVNEDTSATFTCRAHYSDGTDQIVSPGTWAITTGASFAEMTCPGGLNTHAVDADETVGIIASYTEGQSIRSDEIQVAVKNTNTFSSASPDKIVMDNGDPGTSSTGKWRSTKTKSYGRTSVLCRQSRKKYTFETELEGKYIVSFKWTKKARAKSVPVQIWDGNTLIDTVRVNQSKNRNRNRWNRLGAYTFSGRARITVISRYRSTVVDGMKFTKARRRYAGLDRSSILTNKQ